MLCSPKISESICRENQNTDFRLNSPPPPENSALYEILWKMLYSRAGQRRQRGPCALRNGYLSLKTPRLCNNYCFSIATMVSLTPLSVTLYVHCLSCYNLTWFQNHANVTSCKTDNNKAVKTKEIIPLLTLNLFTGNTSIC